MASETATTGATTTPEDSGSPTWVFPFDRPLPPDPGDNQALSVNTTDYTVTYDLAFALVWVDGDDPVTNTNEAYAFASCTDCAAVAVSFQVVLVVGDADVVVPQNLAGALDYNCVRCLTYALATQLVVTLNGPLSPEGMNALNEVWADIAEFAAHITDHPLSELKDRLSAFEQRILDVIVADRAVTLPSSSSVIPSTAEVTTGVTPMDTSSADTTTTFSPSGDPTSSSPSSGATSPAGTTSTRASTPPSSPTVSQTTPSQAVSTSP